MACSHPQIAIERIIRSDGVAGCRCSICRYWAFSDDSNWSTFVKGLRGTIGIYPGLPRGTRVLGP